MLKKLLLPLLFTSISYATVITGTFVHPTGGVPTGTLYLNGPTGSSLLRSCGGTGTGGSFAVPNYVITITNGVLSGSTNVVGNDCLQPNQTQYAATFIDSLGNRFMAPWSITGATMNVNTQILGQAGAIQSLPNGSQVIAQPAGTNLKINNFQVLTELNVPNGSTNPATCSIGDHFFNTSQPAGQNDQGCTATNTWTTQGGGGSVAQTSVINVASMTANPSDHTMAHILLSSQLSGSIPISVRIKATVGITGTIVGPVLAGVGDDSFDCTISSMFGQSCALYSGFGVGYLANAVPSPQDLTATGNDTAQTFNVLSPGTYTGNLYLTIQGQSGTDFTAAPAGTITVTLVYGGPPGPTGQAGPTGSTGPQGPAGAAYLFISSSVSTVTIAGAGAYTFTTQSGLSYQPANYAIAVCSGNPAIYTQGLIASYSTNSLIITGGSTFGNGTCSAWNLGSTGVSGIVGGVTTILSPLINATGPPLSIGCPNCSLSPQNYIFTSVPPTALYISALQAGVDGATLSTWVDSSGNSNNATLASGTPTINWQTVNGVPAIFFNSSSWLTIPSGVSVNKQASTVCMVVDMEGENLSTAYGLFNLGADSTDDAFLNGGHLGSYYGGMYFYAGVGTGNIASGIGPSATGPQPLCFVRGVSSITIYRDDSSTTVAALPSGTETGGQIGAYDSGGDYPYYGNMWEMAIWGSTALSSAQVQDWFLHARQVYNTRQYGPQYVQVVSAGDSITEGTNSTLSLGRPNQSYPVGTKGQFTWIERNIGQGSQTLQAVSGQSVAPLTTVYNSTYAKNVLILAFGYNDLNTNGTSASTLEGYLATYVAAIRSASPGYIILVATITPGPSGGDTAEVQRGLYNTWLTTTTHPGGADGIVDLTADSIMNTYPNNSSYYGASSPHPNNAGYARLAKLFVDAIHRTAFSGVPLVTQLSGSGSVSSNSYCTSSASPAVCGSSAAGYAVIAASATSVVVDSSAVTANSQIEVTRDNSLGTALSVTCDTQSSLVIGTPRVTARIAGTSFTVGIDVGPTTNPMYFAYTITN